MLIQLDKQNLNVSASSDIQTLHYTLERIKIHAIGVTARVRAYTGSVPDANRRVQLREAHRLMLIHNVLREALRYRRNNMHNEKEEDIVKVIEPLMNALDTINNQEQ